MSLSRLEKGNLTFYDQVTNIMASSGIEEAVSDVNSSELEEITGSEENLRAVMIRRILGEDKTEIADDLGLSKDSVTTYTSNLTSAGYLENTGSRRKPDYSPGENLGQNTGFELDELDASRPLESDYPFVFQPMIVLDGVYHAEEGKDYIEDIPDEPEWFSKDEHIEAVDMSPDTEKSEGDLELNDTEQNGSENGIEVKSVNRESIILEGGLAITGNGRLPDVEEGDLVEVEETGETYMHGQFDKVEYVGNLS